MAGKRRKGSWSDVEGWKGSSEHSDDMEGHTQVTLMVRKGPQEALMAGKGRKGSWSDIEGWKGSRECFDGAGGT